MTMTEKKPTTRAIKLTEDSIEVISNRGMHFDLPPSVDELLDTVLLPDEYYFVVDCPGVTPEKTISWVLMPDFMFDKRFVFGTKPTSLQLFSVISKE